MNVDVITEIEKGRDKTGHPSWGQVVGRVVAALVAL